MKLTMAAITTTALSHTLRRTPRMHHNCRCRLQRRTKSSSIQRYPANNSSRHHLGIISASNANSSFKWAKNWLLGRSTSHGYPRLHLHINQNYRHSSSSNKPNTSGPPSLPIQFLEAYDEQKFDPSTHQRNDVLFDPIDGKPPLPSEEDNTSKNKPVSWDYDSGTDMWRLLSEQQGDDGSKSDSSTSYSNNWKESQQKTWRLDSNDFDCDWSSLDDANEANKIHPSKRIIWSNWTETTVRSPDSSPILFQYDNLISRNHENTSTCEQEEERLLKVLYQYGLVLIKGTPTYTDSLPLDVMSEATKATQTNLGQNADNENESAESAILHLASLIGYYPLRTLYGSGVWSTSSYSSFYNDSNRIEDETDGSNNASTADSAYGSTSLPLHTDMTYSTNPPGVQVFLMVQPAEATTPSGKNETSIPTGQSVYLDGFAAAKQLLLENPTAFHTLASTPRTYRCIDDEEGWHLEATGPVIETVSNDRGIASKWGPVKSIRHNDLDRLPDLPPYPTTSKDSDIIHKNDYDAFYQKLKEAHEAWNDILRRDSMRLVLQLEPGDCVLVANQRVMHGRYAFETSKFPRVVMGCYVGMDELMSKWRKIGLNVV